MSDVRNIWQKYYQESRQSKDLYFSTYLINASALPCKTDNTEIVSLYVNVYCWFANRHTSHIGIMTSSLLDNSSFIKR